MCPSSVSEQMRKKEREFYTKQLDQKLHIYHNDPNCPDSIITDILEILIKLDFTQAQVDEFTDAFDLPHVDLKARCRKRK